MAQDAPPPSQEGGPHWPLQVTADLIRSLIQKQALSKILNQPVGASGSSAHAKD